MDADFVSLEKPKRHLSGKSWSRITAEKKRSHARTKRNSTGKDVSSGVPKPIPADEVKKAKQSSLLDFGAAGFHKTVKLKSGEEIRVTPQSVLAQAMGKQHFCVFCNESFGTGAALASHIRNKHPTTNPPPRATVKFKDSPAAPGIGLVQSASFEFVGVVETLSCQMIAV